MIFNLYLINNLDWDSLETIFELLEKPSGYERSHLDTLKTHSDTLDYIMQAIRI